MSPALIVIAVVTALFAGFLAVKAATKWKFCAICAGVSSTWIALFGLYRFGRFPYPVIIAVLMGQSVVGLYYLIERHARGDLLFFRLPFLLTLTTGAYLLLGEVRQPASVLIFLFALWSLFGAAYAYRQVAGIRSLIERVIACCRDW